MKLENRESLKIQRAIAKEAMSAPAHRILVCAGTGCLAGGSAKIYDKFLELAAKEEGVEIKLSAKEAHASLPSGIHHQETAHTGVKRSGCHVVFAKWGHWCGLNRKTIFMSKSKKKTVKKSLNRQSETTVPLNASSTKKMA